MPSLWPAHIFFVIVEGFPWYTPIEKNIEHTLISFGIQVTVREVSQFSAQEFTETNANGVLVMTLPLHLTEQFFQQLNTIRQNGTPTAIWLLDDPYAMDQALPVLEKFDYVFTSESSCAEVYQQQGCSAHWLPLGASVQHYHPLPNITSTCNDICFIGNAFKERIDFFDPIIPQLMRKDISIIGPNWMNSCHYETYKNKITCISFEQWLSSQQTNEYYNGSRISLNYHRKHHFPTLSPNPRTFEICAAGCFQLTDIRVDLFKLYTAGVELETYASREELLEKIEYYLIHEQERKEIALRGLVRTLQEHTYTHRLNTMLSVMFPS